MFNKRNYGSYQAIVRLVSKPKLLEQTTQNINYGDAALMTFEIGYESSKPIKLMASTYGKLTNWFLDNGKPAQYYVVSGDLVPLIRQNPNTDFLPGVRLIVKDAFLIPKQESTQPNETTSKKETNKPKTDFQSKLDELNQIANSLDGLNKNFKPKPKNELATTLGIINNAINEMVTFEDNPNPYKLLFYKYVQAKLELLNKQHDQEAQQFFVRKIESIKQRFLEEPVEAFKQLEDVWNDQTTLELCFDDLCNEVMDKSARELTTLLNS